MEFGLNLVESLNDRACVCVCVCLSNKSYDMVLKAKNTFYLTRVVGQIAQKHRFTRWLDMAFFNSFGISDFKYSFIHATAASQPFGVMSERIYSNTQLKSPAIKIEINNWNIALMKWWLNFTQIIPKIRTTTMTECATFCSCFGHTCNICCKFLFIFYSIFCWLADPKP